MCIHTHMHTYMVCVCSVISISLWLQFRAEVLQTLSMGFSRQECWSVLPFPFLYTQTHDYAVFGCVWLFVTPWTITHQDPLSMEFFRQDYWSVLPFPSPGNFRTQGLNLHLLHYKWMLYHPSSKPCCFSCSVLSGSSATPWTIAH